MKTLTNSRLNKLRREITGEPEPDPARFHMGRLHDALITAPETVNYIERTVTDRFGNVDHYTLSEMTIGLKMKRAFEENPACLVTLTNSDRQTVIENDIEWAGITFACECRCDLRLRRGKTIIDLKKTSARSEDEFRERIDKYHYDQQAAFFSAVGSGSPFIFLAQSSVKPYTVFSIFADHEILSRGKEKIEELIPYL
jgi:hypothetical protein